jgi:hypothetical protein
VVEKFVGNGFKTMDHTSGVHPTLIIGLWGANFKKYRFSIVIIVIFTLVSLVTKQPQFGVRTALLCACDNTTGFF